MFIFNPYRTVTVLGNSYSSREPIPTGCISVSIKKHEKEMKKEEGKEEENRCFCFRSDQIIPNTNPRSLLPRAVRSWISELNDKMRVR